VCHSSTRQKGAPPTPNMYDGESWLSCGGAAGVRWRLHLAAPAHLLSACWNSIAGVVPAPRRRGRMVLRRPVG